MGCTGRTTIASHGGEPVSQVKLNLGAGTFPFPYERDNEPNKTHVLPLPDEVYEPGWINIDKFALPGIQEQINLFRFPWIRSSNGNPFNQSSVDYIYAAHLLEHVPHEVKVSNKIPLGWKEYGRFVEEFDGFFVFFAEAWRILKPGGLIHLRVPYGVSYDALCDPTHTRRIVPGTLSYLTDRNEDTPFDYGTQARFEMVGEITWRMAKEMAERMKDYTAEGFQYIVRNGTAQITGFDITLRALKE
jgi:predicted SAM-dependent methyltransferase